MSYYSQNQDRTPIGFLTNAADHQAKKLRRAIEENESMSSGIALRIARGQKFEELLGRETVEKFREELKENATQNIAMERSLQAYVSATRVVCGNANAAMNQHGNEHETETDIKPHQFEDQMNVDYMKAMEDIERTAAPVTQDPTYAKLCRLLGEDEEQDDELAVVNDHDTSGNEIKCPLTMVLMENPVRSSVCGHSFERDAILQHLRKSKKCPKPGCTNVRMTPDEFSDDPDTAMKVRRHKKREEATKRAQARSAIDMDMDDDLDELQL
eukprot:jgi/Psemu1/288454/fgenesh1_pg.261_\